MAIDPAKFGMPHAGNTGVRPDKKALLTAYKPGPIADGAVIENKIIKGMLEIGAKNVTLRNCLIQGIWYWGVNGENALGLVLEDCEIDGRGTAQTSGVLIGGVGTHKEPKTGQVITRKSAVRRCNIHGMTLGIVLMGDCDVTDNYIHDLGSTSSDPDARHFDGITLHVNGRCLIQGNTILLPEGYGGTACLFITSKFGPVDDVIVRKNLMAGDPSYTIYCTVDGKRPITNVLIEANFLEKGGYGFINIEGCTPVVRDNVQWTEAKDPTPYPSSGPAPKPDPTPDPPPPPPPAYDAKPIHALVDGLVSQGRIEELKAFHTLMKR